MSQPGLGAMLHYLGGGSQNDPDKYYGRKITDAKISDERLALSFEDGTSIQIWDNGQSCCENRYMSTDDDPKCLIGKTLTKIEAKEHQSTEAEYDKHEMVFVEIAAEDQHITIVNHNEHNGYYGGFGLTITEDGKDE